jgi:hypothetical protein
LIVFFYINIYAQGKGDIEFGSSIGMNASQVTALVGDKENRLSRKFGLNITFQQSIFSQSHGV